MIANRINTLLLPCIAFSLPLSAALAARLFIPLAGPTQARASTAPLTADRVLTFPEPLPLRPDQLTLAHRLAQPQTEQTPPASPFIASRFNASPEAVANDLGIQLPSAQVTSIMARGISPMAIIDGQLFRVGDELGDGWSVLRIDPDGVVLLHETGVEHILTVH